MNALALDRLRAALAHRLHDARITPGTGRLLVCVSGGADSVCLLRLLQERALPLAVFHLDHRTRGEDSAQDATFVESLTHALRIPFHLVVRDVPALAAASGLSLEETGRNARYEEAWALAAALGYAAIVTAHHAGDQVETVLMRVIRGTGLHGLGGIAPERAAQGQAATPLLRPLIDCTRADIEAALHALDQPWRHDASNDARHALRNRIRLDLLPLLRADYNPAMDTALLRLAEAARADEALLASLAQHLHGACVRDAATALRAPLAAGPLALQRRVVMMLLEQWNIAATFDRVEAVRRLIVEGAVGEALDLDGVLFYNNRAVTEIARDAVEPPVPPMPLTIPGETRIHGRAYRARFRAPEAIGDPRAYCSPARQVFDADALLGDAAVRSRQEGDRFQPLGLHGEKKLKDWFIDHGITRRERARQHLVTVDDRILWVVGHAIDARGAVTPATRRVVEIEVSDEAQ